MKNIVKTCTVLLFVITAGAMMVPSFTDTAGAQQCFLEICKSAEGAGETGFTIFIDEGGMISEIELFDEGDCFTESFTSEFDLEVVEGTTPGWVFDNVICEGSSDIEILGIPGAIVAECNTTAEASTTCTFVNVQGSSVANVPTLSEWGMIAAGAGLVLIGVYYALRRRAVKA